MGMLLGAANTGPLILVIDDDPVAQELLGRRLAASGYRVAIESDGGAGIFRARSDAPALVICDLHMPLAPGELVILSLRMDPRTAKIPILVLSADPGRLGREHQVDLALSKPVRPAELLAAIARLTGTPLPIKA
ncbi:MAG: response regulator [Thermomicrobiales bacterium]|nr:response regulator [Thermomicrobiales bacterium]